MNKQKSFFKKILLPFTVLAVGAMGSMAFMIFKPTPDRKDSNPIATFVTTEKPQYENRNGLIVGYGSVIPDKTLTLSPQISGMVLAINESLEPGGFVSKNEELIQIDPRDYQLAVVQQESAVAKSEFNLKVELGRKAVAEREWSLLEESIEKSPLGEELARREAHITEKIAALEAAKSKLKMAQINLKRATLTAPFDSFIKSCSLEIGALVISGSPIASLIGSDRVFVEASVPISFLNEIEKNAKVKIILNKNNTSTTIRNGHVHRILPEVDSAGRMGQILVSLNDPFSLKDSSNDPIYLNSYVRIEIEGLPYKKLLKIQRKHVREDNKIWVMNSQKLLSYRTITPIINLEEYLFGKCLLKEGDVIITSNLPAPLPGMALRTKKGDAKN